MQAVFTTLPKLNLLRHHPITAPKIRQWNLTLRELCFHLLKLRFQRLARINPTALLGRPSRQLATLRATQKVLHHIRSSTAAPHGHPQSPAGLAATRESANSPEHCPQSRQPCGCQDWYRTQSHAFIEVFKQHHALPRLALGIHRGNTHGSGVLNISLNRLRHPPLKLLQMGYPAMTHETASRSHIRDDYLVGSYPLHP